LDNSSIFCFCQGKRRFFGRDAKTQLNQWIAKAETISAPAGTPIAKEAIAR
jgi:hypothetical protein